jgi:hypothetical protein
MGNRDDTRCIRPCRRGGKITPLCYADLMQAVIKDLPRADEQYPGTLAFIGNVEKSHAMRTLFGVQNKRNPKTTHKSCEIYFHLDPMKASDKHPLLLVNWDVRRSCDKWSRTKRNKCYEAAQSILHQLPARESVSHNFHTQLLSPFVDTFCFFSSDLGGLRQIAQRLARWLELGNSSTLPVRTLPSLVIITSSVNHKAKTGEEDIEAFIAMLREETSEDPFQQLSAIDVFALQPEGAVSAKTRFKRFKKHLIQRLEQVHKNRREHQVSFSATHMAAFFKFAISHFAEFPDTPFDFVRASRSFNSIAPDMHEHLSNFLKYITSAHQLKDFAAPMIASSLFLDSYPPDAHSQEPLSVDTY